MAQRATTDRIPGDLVSVRLEAGASVVVRWRLPVRPDRMVVDSEVRVLQAARERAQLGFATP